MLEAESGISAEMIAQRGSWTAFTAAELPEGFAPYQRQSWMFPILVIPQWNSVGRRFAHTLRPDHPRRGKDGKVIKYEAQPGAPVGFDIHPAMVPLLRDPSVPLYITEGSKKADAMASRGLPCLSLNGVYGFLHKRVVVSELDEIALDGRIARPIFDSDVMTKAGVADALNRLGGAASRRGATVEAVYLPDGGDGKTGVDDFFVSGGTPADLDTLTRPWEVIRQSETWDEPPGTGAEPALIDTLRARLVQERHARIESDRLNYALIRLITNPYVTETQKTVIVRMGDQAVRQRRNHQTEDGRARLSTSEISGDWRPSNAKTAFNKDGSRFLMPRKKVQKTIDELNTLAPISFAREKSRRRHPIAGREYGQDVILDAPETLSGFIRPYAWFQPAQPTERKTPTKPVKTQAPCPHCGEVHDIERTDRCTGCDGVIRATTIPAPPPPAPVEDRHNLGTSPSTLLHMRVHNLGASSPAPDSPPLDPRPEQESPPRSTLPPTRPGEPWLPRGAYTIRHGVFSRVDGETADHRVPPEDERRRMHGEWYRGDGAA